MYLDEETATDPTRLTLLVMNRVLDHYPNWRHRRSVQVYLLWAVFGMTHREFQRRMGLSRDVVEKCLFQGRRYLDHAIFRQELDRDDLEDLFIQLKDKAACGD